MTDVAIDGRVTRRMSVGTRAYRRQLLERLPAVAPDLNVATFGGGENLTLSEFVDVPLRIARLHPRLVHYLTIFAPLVTPAPYVVTIHDLIQLQFPHLFSAGPRYYYALLGARLARGARRLIVGDERTVGECERLLGVPAARCSVVPLGYDPRMLATPPVISERPYVLYAGNHRAHKNLVTLFTAWRDLPERLDVDLHCTGFDRDGFGERYRRARGRLVFLGDLAEADLWREYRGAHAYVHPALAEGFGIPMLEALALGTSVIAAEECVPSVVRPYAALFPARDPGALAELLMGSLEDAGPLRARAAEGARAVRSYTWDRFAERIAALYREVA